MEGSPRIIAPLVAQEDDNVLVSEGIDPQDYGHLTDLDGQELFDYLVAHGDEILAGSAQGTYELRGGSGDDVLVASGGTDVLGGGQGADNFVFVASDSAHTPAVDQILDFHAGEDVIALVAAEGSRIDSTQPVFDESSQQLHYHTENSMQTQHVTITSHDGNLLSEADILKSIHIL